MSTYKPVENAKTVFKLTKKKPTKEGFYLVAIPAYGNIPYIARVRKTYDDKLDILYGCSMIPLKEIDKSALFSGEIFIEGYTP